MNDSRSSKSEFFESAEELYHDAPCGYASFKNDGTIYNINATLLKWLGFDRDEILEKKKIYELFNMGGKLFFETHFFPLIRIQGFANEINFEIRKKDNSTFPALINVKEIKGSASTENRYRASVYDISDRKKYGQELYNAKIKAEKTAKDKADFLATISHEIRTPLNGVLGIGNLLAKTSLTAKQKEFVDILKLSSENLLGLVNNLLDLSKLEAQALHLEKKPFAIRTVVNSIIHTFELKCKEKGIQLLAEIDENIPNYIIGDPIKLNQVLTNLIGNAIKFTCDGYVKLLLNPGKNRENKLDLEFKIIDTGTGIPENKLQSIFEEFSQANYDLNSEYGGTGLGLSISQQLLRLHDSEIKVKSEIDKGSEFSFNIAYEIYKPSRKEISGINKDSQSDKKKIDQAKLLIVEDNPVNILIISEYLKDWKINFDTVENGSEAIEAAKKKKYDVILMDLHMPVINGFEASSTIRNLHLDKQPVILALSATNKENIQSELDRAGIDDFISKPFGPGDLHRVISSYIITNKKQKKKTIESGKIKTSINTEVDPENSEKSFDLSRFVKMANEKPDFLRKFIQNTSIAFEDYHVNFMEAVKLEDDVKISELIHKSTMSVYYIQSDRLARLLKECQQYFENKNSDMKNVRRKINETTAEFNKIIDGLKNIDAEALINEESNITR